MIYLPLIFCKKVGKSISNTLWNFSHLHLASSYATAPWLFTTVPIGNTALAPKHPLKGWPAEVGSPSKPCHGLPFRWELFIIFWKVSITDVTRQTSKHTLPEPRACWGRHAHTCQYQKEESGWGDGGSVFCGGERCSEVLLMSLCGHAVFSACHHGWDSAACLLLRMHWHFSGAYPRILLSGRRLNEALPGDRGRKLHHPSGALLCAGCHPNCYCKYRIDFFVTVRSEITFPVFLFSFFLPSWAFTSSLTGVSCSSQSLEWNSAFKKKKKTLIKIGLVFYRWLLFLASECI